MKKLFYLFMIPLAIGISCGEDDGAITEEEEVIDLTDANAVSDAITIAGATVVTGNPPAQTTDPDTPVLNAPDDGVTAAEGVDAVINVDVTSGTTAGIYFQIKGADEYFDIPISSSAVSGGRLEEEYFALNIPIPDGLGTGTFCAEYCVYDAEARVSNAVEVCIEIVSLGGDNAEFLTANVWQLVKEIEEYDNMTEEYVIGETNIEVREEYVSCDGGGQELVTITEEYRTDYLYVTFSSNGAIGVEEKDYEKEFDWDNSTCQNLLYVEETEISSQTGVWSYDDVTKMVVLVLEEEDDDGTIYVDVIELSASLSNGQLILVNEDDGGTFTLIFEPKN